MPSRPCQPSLIFLGKDRAYLIESPLRFSMLQWTPGPIILSWNSLPSDTLQLIMNVHKLQNSLMFVGKARSLPMFGASSSLTQKHQTRLERPSSDRHSSLLQTLINHRCKKFYNILPCPCTSHCKCLHSSRRSIRCRSEEVPMSFGQ